MSSSKANATYSVITCCYYLKWFFSIDFSVKNLCPNTGSDIKDTYFIPAFYEREEAEGCLPLMQKVADRSYGVQAMRSEEVTKAVKSHSYQLFILDGTGRVLEIIDFK